MWPMMASWAININTNPGCGRTTDPDMVRGSSPGLDVTMIPSDSTGHQDQHGPLNSAALGQQYGPMCRPRPQAPTQSPVPAGCTNINKRPYSQPGPFISLELGGQLATHFNLFDATLTFRYPPLSPAHKPSAFPSPLPPHSVLSPQQCWTICPSPEILVGSWVELG